MVSDNPIKPTEGVETVQGTGSAVEPSLSAGEEDWRRKAFLFLAGQGVSLFGSALVQYAIIWHVTLSTQSGSMMTISALAAMIPQLLISLFAGVWADRYNRKMLIILADVLIAIPTLILAVLYLMGYRMLWLLFLISAIRSVGSGVQSPAVSAMIPQIVPQDKLARINGINGSIQSAVMLLSPAASGALISLSTIETIFFVDVVTAMIAVTIMWMLKVPMHKITTDMQTQSQIENLKAGIRYAGRNVFVRSLLFFYAVCFVLITPVSFLTPLMIARSYGDEVWRLTANEMVFFIGSIVGGGIFSVWSGHKNRIYTTAAGCFVFGLFTMALGLSGVFHIYLLFMGLLGLGMPFFNNPVMVLLQEKVAQGMLGRVFSIMQIVAASAMPVGMLVFGPLAEVVRVEELLIVSGALVALLGLSLFKNKGLQNIV
ncbi:MAG TPA: MFS transporter [Firmicutes bacterium]|jgi:DHA3 family macrolide efflux protein-like MFS transporter|nr:MFS transporter [Bacillota bacterium]